MAQVETQQSIPPPTAAPAKRKRKTGSGATADCFACLKSQTTCDRVRPYCGQCLLQNRECSGYKTVLTWGVGVASRGKLRGKTLPIQKSENVADQLRTSPKPRNVKRQKTEAHEVEDAGEKTDAQDTRVPPSHKRSRTSSSTSTQYAGHDHRLQQSRLLQAKPQDLHNPQHQSSQLQQQEGDTQHVLSYQQQFHTNMFAQHQYQSRSQTSHANPSTSDYNHQRPPEASTQMMHRLRTSVPYLGDGSTGSTSKSSLVSPADYYPSPYDQRNHVFSPREEQQQRLAESHNEQAIYGYFRSPGQRPILNNYAPTFDSTSQGSRSPFGEHPTSRSSISTIHTEPLASQPETPFAEKTTSSFAWDGVLTTNGLICDRFTEIADNDEELPSATEVVPFVPRTPFDLSFPELPSRMQGVLDYYDKAICPFLVVFDGPENPYRKHIMQLAVQSPGLRNAMAALVTNNTRMRQLSDGTDLINDTRTKLRRDSLDLILSPGLASAEEQHYKTKSIELLNEQLTSGNYTIASSDTVLASLLILCLYHVCNSGFSKFKTQLAGVQKVLRMRRKDSLSSFSSWVEMFFAWLDVLTSAVNDRETEIRGDSLDMANLTANLGALEQFCGCDGRLFKIIARLGRLNLLSQNRPVREDDESIAITEEGESTLSSTELGKGFGKDFYAPIFEDVTRRRSSSHATQNIHHPSSDPSDDRSAFWREWRSIRGHLNDWSVGVQPDNSALTKSQSDMMHLSEAFRFSALLYIERLAHPDLPSSNADLQDKAEHTLSHIEEIGEGSCVTKFMLWPLFITGTECFQERHRDLIRARCIEIQKESGFFNNVTGLRVLERVWREADSAVGGVVRSGKVGQAFRWRTAMDRLDGEYIVI